jgi:membrane protease YdiL (CAAX protease family)
MIAFLRRHPVTSYFALAFAISWAGVMAVIGSGPIPAPPAEAERLFSFVYLAMLVGPPAAGLSMTALTSGRSGLRDYVGRLINWRLGARWYAIALVTAPLTLALTLLVLAPWSREFIPAFRTSDPRGPLQAESAFGFLTLAVLVGIGAGFFEELGWTRRD